ncbi:MAG: winged helix-turn-helix domain-containing protein [Candidatus Nanoarchaeia archaeon]
MEEIEKAQLLANLFDRKTVEILKKLLLKTGNFYIRDLSKETGVPLATTFRIIQKLTTLNLVQKKEMDKFVFYSVNKEAPIYNEVQNLVFGTTNDPIELFKKALRERYGGSFTAYQDKDKKIFVVSDILKEAEVSDIANFVQQKTEIKPNYILITRDFFQKMQEMGLIQRDKLQVI